MFHIIMISADHVTLKIDNDAENTALITEINYTLTHIHIEKNLFYIAIIFLNITVFLI